MTYLLIVYCLQNLTLTLNSSLNLKIVDSRARPDA